MTDTSDIIENDQMVDGQQTADIVEINPNEIAEEPSEESALAVSSITPSETTTSDDANHFPNPVKQTSDEAITTTHNTDPVEHHDESIHISDALNRPVTSMEQSIHSDPHNAQTTETTPTLIVEIEDPDASNGDAAHHIIIPPLVNSADPESSNYPQSSGAPDLIPETTTHDVEAGLEGEANDELKNVARDPVQLEWKNLRFDVKVKGKHRWSKKEDKTVLYPMSGYVRPGEILAIMGPSGAGKTSLLNILAQRELNYSGNVRVNGKKLPRSFKNFSAYVEQDDVIHANLTVLQALRYSAFLRLPTFMSVKEKMARVHEVIAILGLERAKHTRVGSPGGEKGISGGERKRLAIAVEILKRPSLLFLDEPTSGMDAKTSLNIMKAIRNLARTGTTVIMTIHQPRSQIFSYFDHLLLLADGKVAYHGEAAKVEEYFTHLDPKYALPRGFNIADHVIDLVTRGTVGDAATLHTEDNGRIKRILDHWEQKHAQVTKNPPPVENATDLRKIPNYSSSRILQYFVLLARNLNNIVKDHAVTMGKFMQTAVMLILLSSLYFRMENDQTSIIGVLGLLFFVQLSQSMGSMFMVLRTFPEEYRIFKREHSSRAYSTASYYFAKVSAEIPHQVIFPLLFGAIIYWIVGFNANVGRFFTFLLIIVSIALTAVSIGEVISVIVPDEQLALLLAPVLIVVFVFFSGFYIAVDSIPVYYVWLYWISPFNYSFAALASNEFLGKVLRCEPDELVPPNTGICPITLGDQKLAEMGMRHNYYDIWINIGVLWAMTIALKVIGFLVLLARTNTLRATFKRHIRNKRDARKELRKSMSASSNDLSGEGDQ